MKLTTAEYCDKMLFNYIRLKGYSLENTYPVYRANLNLILKRFPEPKDATILELQDFAAEFKNDNTRRNICIIIRWLFSTVYDRNIDWRQLPYPKRTKKVQSVYLEQDILKVLNAIKNAKQKAILALIIDCGLRISEPCSILLSDCNSKEASIILRSAKGNQDRVIYPSEGVWKLISLYWNSQKEKPTRYLFEGWKAGHPYTSESIRETIKRYCGIVGVKYLGVHAIRRFTITWSVENEVPISVVATKVGHASTRTIEKHYLIHSPTYLRGVKSPLR